jgi:hypothetical protein
VKVKIICLRSEWRSRTNRVHDYTFCTHVYAVGEKNHQFKYYVLASLKVAMFLFSFAGNTLTTLTSPMEANTFSGSSTNKVIHID